MALGFAFWTLNLRRDRQTELSGTREHGAKPRLKIARVAGRPGRAGRRAPLTRVLAVALFAGWCTSEWYDTDARADDSLPHQVATSEHVETEGPIITRGKPLSAKARKEIVTIGELNKRAKELDGKDVALSGVVEKVCQQKGCWFTLTQPDQPGSPSVRITSKGYLFFVPKNTSGYHAVVEGTFNIKTLSAEEAGHFAADEAKMKAPSGAGVDPHAPASPTAGEPVQSGVREEYQFSAVGVELRPHS